MNDRTFRKCARTVIAMALFGILPLANAVELLDLRGVAPIHGDAAAGAAKATVCIACHGPNGNSVVPAFPSLSGQKADYLYWELVSFKRGTSPQSPMTAIVTPLDDSDLRNLAAYFASQMPTSITPPVPPSTNRGEQLFRSGDATHGTPPCQGCHGTDGGGIDDPRFPTWPTLRGQHADYVSARLKAYRDGTAADSSNDFIMQGVARTLDDESIAALAAWIGSLPPSSH